MEQDIKDLGIVQQLKQKNLAVLHKNRNRVAFRATPQEIGLLIQLQKAYQLSDLSGVLHRILAEYGGFVIERSKRIASMKADIEQYSIDLSELFVKGLKR